MAGNDGVDAQARATEEVVRGRRTRRPARAWGLAAKRKVARLVERTGTMGNTARVGRQPGSARGDAASKVGEGAGWGGGQAAPEEGDAAALQIWPPAQSYCQN